MSRGHVMCGSHVVAAAMLLLVGLHFGSHWVAGNALLKPAHRGMVWARSAVNSGGYDYMGVNCGGIGKIQRFDGMCGLCGDAFDGARTHETGGEYATGEITKVVRRGERTMPVSILLNGKQGGYFEFALCNNVPETRECFDTNLVKITEGRAQGDEFGYWPNQPGVVSLTLEIPDNFQCERCVLQWKYVTGNTWGRDEKGHGCRGCGPQETFVNCADVRIEGWGTDAPPTTLTPPTTLPPPTTKAAPTKAAPLPTAPPTQSDIQFSLSTTAVKQPSRAPQAAPTQTRQAASSPAAPDRDEGSIRGNSGPTAAHSKPSPAPANQPSIVPPIGNSPASAVPAVVAPVVPAVVAPVVAAVVAPLPQPTPTVALIIANRTLPQLNPQPTVALAKVLTDVSTYVKRAVGPAMIPKPPALSDQQIDALSSDQHVLPNPDPLQTYVQVGSSKLVVAKDYMPPQQHTAQNIPPPFPTDSSMSFSPEQGGSRGIPSPGFSSQHSGSIGRSGPGFSSQQSGATGRWDPGFSSQQSGATGRLDPGFSSQQSGSTGRLGPNFSPQQSGSVGRLSPDFSPLHNGSPGLARSSLPGPGAFDKQDFMSFANAFSAFAQQMGQNSNLPIPAKTPTAATINEYTPATDGAITGFNEFGNNIVTNELRASRNRDPTVVNDLLRGRERMAPALNEPWGARDLVTPEPNDPWGSRGLVTQAPMVTKKVYDRYGVLMEKTVNSNKQNGGSTRERNEFVDPYLQPAVQEQSANRLSASQFDSKANTQVRTMQINGQDRQSNGLSQFDSKANTQVRTMQIIGQDRQSNGMLQPDSSQNGGYDHSWREGPVNVQASKNAAVDIQPEKPKSPDSWRRAPVHEIYTTKAPIDRPLQLFRIDARTTYRPQTVVKERYTNFEIGGKDEGIASLNSEPALNTRNYDVPPSKSTSSLQGTLSPLGGNMTPVNRPDSLVPHSGPREGSVHQLPGTTNTSHTAVQHASSTGGDVPPTVAPLGQDSGAIGKKIEELNSKLDALKMLLNFGQVSVPTAAPTTTTTTTTTTAAPYTSKPLSDWGQASGLSSLSESNLDKLKRLLGLTDAPIPTTTPAPPVLQPRAPHNNRYQDSIGWNQGHGGTQQQHQTDHGHIAISHQNVFVDPPQNPLQWSSQTTTPSFPPYQQPNPLQMPEVSSQNHWPESGPVPRMDPSHSAGNHPNQWSDNRNSATSFVPDVRAGYSPNQWSDNGATSAGSGSVESRSLGRGPLHASSLVSGLNRNIDASTIPPTIDPHSKEIIQDIKAKMLASIRQANTRGRQPHEPTAGEGLSWQNQRWQEMQAPAHDAQPSHVNYNVPSHVPTSNGRQSHPPGTHDASSNIDVQSLSPSVVLEALRQMAYSVGGPPPAAGYPPLREMHLKNKVKMERIKPLMHGETSEEAHINVVVTTQAPTTTTQRQRLYTKTELDYMRERVAMIQSMRRLAEERPTQIDPSHPRPSHLSPGKSRPTQLGNIENVGREPQEPNNNRPTHISRHPNNNRPSLVSYLESKRNQEASAAAQPVSEGLSEAAASPAGYETNGAQNFTEAEKIILDAPGLSIVQRMGKLLELRRMQKQNLNERKPEREAERALISEIPMGVNEVKQSWEVISSQSLDWTSNLNDIQPSREASRHTIHDSEPSRDVMRPPVRENEPPRDVMRPPARDNEPPRDVMWPPVRDSEPSTNGMRPPVRGNEPSTNVIRPPVRDRDSSIDIMWPPVRDSEPSIDEMTPPVRGNAPSRDVMRPPVRDSEPSKDIIKSPVRGKEPSRDVMRSPVRDNEPSRDVMRPPVRDSDVLSSREITATNVHEPPVPIPMMGKETHETPLTQDNIGQMISRNGEPKNVIAIPLDRDMLFKIVQFMKQKNAVANQGSSSATGL